MIANNEVLDFSSVFLWHTKKNFFPGQPVIDVPKPVKIFFKRIKQYLYGKLHLGVVFEEKFL
jgi:hypothetical protein